MSQHVIEDIHHYVSFLESIGYKISFSLQRKLFTPYFHQLLKYDVHDHAVCDYLKQNPTTAGRCVLNKQKLLGKDLTQPYYGCCYAGLEEFLIPVRYDDKLLGCVHVSGYRGRLERSWHRMEQVSTLCDNRFSEYYQALPTDVPTMDRVLSFTKPLSYMIVELYQSCEEQRKSSQEALARSSLYLKALQFIYENAAAPITCERLAEELNYSVSYLHHIFRKEGNTSVGAKIAQVRMERAQRLLRGTTMSVTDIAFSIGFEDSNYFSYVFKKHVGCSPLSYRKSFKEGNKN